jgi:cell filamentation protein
MQSNYNYSYNDGLNQYTYSNGVLKNLANIQEEQALLLYESLKVSKRIEELFVIPIKITNSESLLEIHQCLFQDVYEWAGKIRTVNISKDGKPFFEGERFPMGFKYINTLIDDFERLSSKNTIEISQKLAEILDNLNFLHPFREGNGRTQREFIRTLALQKGFKLNLNPPDNKSIYDRYMKGTIQSDINLLKELILEELKPPNFNF